MTPVFTESTVEDAALEIFGTLGYTIVHGPTIAPGEMFAERASYCDVVLLKRLREALARINPEIPPDALDAAVRKLLRTESPSLVEHRRADRIIHDHARLIPSHTPANNHWVAVNQFTIEENRRNRRPDVIVFV